VPLNFRTDGIWIWTESCADGVAPRRALAVLQQPPETAVPADGKLAVNAPSVCSRAWRMTSARERAPSLAKMCDTWVCTVLRDSSNSAAMSGLDRPSATREAIFASVGVSASHPRVAPARRPPRPRRIP
jgi:hypothetical protein